MNYTVGRLRASAQEIWCRLGVLVDPSEVIKMMEDMRAEIQEKDREIEYLCQMVSENQTEYDKTVQLMQTEVTRLGREIVQWERISVN